MNWDKINLKACLKILREMDKEFPPTLDEPEKSIAYNDGVEELKISYRRILK